MTELLKKIQSATDDQLIQKNLIGEITLLFTAEEIEEFKALKARGVNLKSVNRKYQTVLTALVKKDKVDTVRYLLENEGFDAVINYAEEEAEKTPAFYAKSADMVNLLAQYGADLSISDENGESIVHRTFTLKEKDLLRAYLSNGADANEGNLNGDTPLFKQKFPEIASIFVEFGANPLTTNKFGYTAMHDYLQDYKYGVSMAQWQNDQYTRLGVPERKEEDCRGVPLR